MYSIRKPISLLVCILIMALSINIIVNASHSESDSNEFCTLNGFCYVEWDNYPQYYIDIISHTQDFYAYDVDEIQVVGDLYIDDVFITRLDAFEYDTWEAEEELYSSGEGGILGIDCFHYADKSNFSQYLSTYTFDYTFCP